MVEQLSMFDLLKPCESRFTSECRTGSGFEGGKVRIYCASCNLGLKDFACFLKEEYGTGGHSSTFPDGERGFTDYNAKGMTIRAWKSREEERHSWQEVAKEVKRLICDGQYLTAKEWEKVQEVSRKNGAPLPIPRVGIEAVMK